MMAARTFHWSHQGLAWVVVTHALMNAGLFAVAFHAFFVRQLARPWEVAKVLGAGRGRRVRHVLLPGVFSLVAKNFVLIFAVCLVSFSIPFVLGGMQALSLEVHIFRLMRSEGAWGLALFYSLLQSVAVFLVSALLFFFEESASLRRPSADKEMPPRRLARWWMVLGFLPLLCLIFFWGKDLVWDGLSGFYGRTPLGVGADTVGAAAFNSVLLFLLVFLLQVLMCAVVTWNDFSAVFENFFQGYVAPSVAVLGFSFGVLPGDSEILLLVKTAFCFTLMTFPLLFKWQVVEKWKEISGQTAVARSLGASKSAVFWNVVWPQVKGESLQMAQLAAVWSLGDFAVSSFFLPGGRTLALLVIDLLNKYRMEWASLLAFVVFLLGLVGFYGSQKALKYVRD